MLTKKKLTSLMIFMLACYFVMFFVFLPSDLVESGMHYNKWFFASKIAFLSFSASVATSFILVFIFKRKYIKQQTDTFIKFSYLLKLLVKRDFVSRYRKSVLGVIWSLLNPLLTMLVMTMVFSYLFRFGIPNFPVYLLSGQIIFGFFSESTSMAMGSITGNAGIIRKVYVPKYIFPLSRVISSLVNLAFSFLAFLLVFIITRAQFHWTIFLIPIPIIYTFIFSLGIGLLLSSLSVFFNDINYLYGVFLTMLMYLSALFYPVSSLPDWVQRVLALNPIYQFIDYFRCLALDGTVPGLWTNIVCIGFALAALCSGLYVFMSQQDRYILYM